MRRSKTLQQNEVEMMDLMLASWINGNFKDFKDYYKMLNKGNRRVFINYVWCNTENSEFYDIIDFLLF